MTHSIYDMTFRRKFSVNPYKTLRMKLGEMSFWKDWLNTNRGDPYPVIARAGAGAAVSVILMIPPIIVFLYSQNSVMETMSHSGLK